MAAAAPDILVRRGLDSGLAATLVASALLHGAAVLLLVVLPNHFFVPQAKLQSYTVDLVAPDVVGGTNLIAGGGRSKPQASKPIEPPSAPAPKEDVKTSMGAVAEPAQQTAKAPPPEPAAPARLPEPAPPPAAVKPPEPAKPAPEPAKPVNAAAPVEKIPESKPAPLKPAPPPKPAVAEPKPDEVKPVAKAPAKVAEKPAPAEKPPAGAKPEPKAAEPAKPPAVAKANDVPKSQPTPPAKAVTEATTEKNAGAAAKQRDDEIAAAIRRRSSQVQGEAASAHSDADKQIAAAVQRRAQQVGTGSGSGPNGPGGPVGIGPGSGVGGTPAGLEYILYHGRMEQKIKAAWAWAGADKALQAVIQFNLSADGQIANVRTVRSSGDRQYDASCERAVRAANPLEPVPEKYRKEFATVEMTFKPTDVSQ